MTPLTAVPLAYPDRDFPSDESSMLTRNGDIEHHFERLRDLAITRRFHRNETIVSEGDLATEIFRISAGCVRLVRHIPDSRRHVAEFLFAGDIIGIGAQRYYLLSAEAIGAVTLDAYPRTQFERLGEGNPRLAAGLIKHLSNALTIAHTHLFQLSCQSARERVATFLMRLSTQQQLVYGERVDIPMSRQDMADHLGLTIETVCRALATLRKDGVIETPVPQLFVLKNRAALRAAAEGRAYLM